MLDNTYKEDSVAVTEIAGLYKISISTQNGVLQLCCERLLARGSVHASGFVRAGVCVARRARLKTVLPGSKRFPVWLLPLLNSHTISLEGTNCSQRCSYIVIRTKTPKYKRSTYAAVGSASGMLFSSGIYNALS